MKKFFLALALLLVSVISSFAYQTAIYAGPPTGYDQATVNINMNCSYVHVDAYWSTSVGGPGNGSVAVYADDNTVLGEHTYYEGSTDHWLSSGVFTYRYWGSVFMFISAFNCTGTLKLTWMP